MALKSISHPSGGFALNTLFYDDRWGSAPGTSVFDQAPVFAALSRPHDWHIDFDDFHNFNFDTAATQVPQWTQTLVNSATAPLSLSITNPGGLLLFTTTAANGDAVQIQKLSCWNLHATKALYFECGLSIDTAGSTTQLHAGLSVTDTSLAASDPSDGVFFSKDSADANIDAVTAATTATDTDTTSDIVDATLVRLGFIATTTSVGFYVNGVLKTTSTALIPAASADLRPSFALLTTSGAKIMSLDYMRILQAR